MITKLTPEQNAQIPIWRKKWFEIGTCTKPADKQTAEKTVIEMLKIVNQYANQEIIWCKSWKEAELLLNKKSGIEPPQKLKYFGSWFDGQIDSYWVCFYLFCRDVLGIKYKNKDNTILDLHAQLCQSASRVYFFEKIIIICDRPEYIGMKNDRLHNEKGKSVQFRDGWGVYNLNGVRVPKWLVETPAEKIDPQLALKETNADVQREIIRKIGAEKMLKASGAKLIDEADDPNTGLHYQLQEMVVGNIKRRYLYFEHASMPGVYYAKPVPIESKTALHARAWILSLIERDKLKAITTEEEAELIANFPGVVS